MQKVTANSTIVVGDGTVIPYRLSSVPHVASTDVINQVMPEDSATPIMGGGGCTPTPWSQPVALLTDPVMYNTDIGTSQLMVELYASTVTSWSNILDARYSKERLFITRMVSKMTIELRIWNSGLRIIPLDSGSQIGSRGRRNFYGYMSPRLLSEGVEQESEEKVALAA